MEKIWTQEDERKYPAEADHIREVNAKADETLFNRWKASRNIPSDMSARQILQSRSSLTSDEKAYLWTLV